MSPAARALAAELLGTAFLLAAIVGSGIMAQQLSPGDEGLQLLENGLATAAALAALIVAFGGISGAHFNPAVSLADALLGGTPWSRVPGLVAAQVGGGALGVLVTHLAFDLPAVEVALRERAGGGLWLGEAVATLGLVLVIFLTVRRGHRPHIPMAVAAYVFGAIFFTSSTCFANPAVTVARALTNSFTAIAPGSVPAFVAVQLVAACAAAGLVKLLAPTPGSTQES